jgi:hypothetical protein
LTFRRHHQFIAGAEQRRSSRTFFGKPYQHQVRLRRRFGNSCRYRNRRSMWDRALVLFSSGKCEWIPDRSAGSWRGGQTLSKTCRLRLHTCRNRIKLRSVGRGRRKLRG